MSAAADQLAAEAEAADEERWSVVVGSAHRARKTPGKAKRYADDEEARRSDRLAAKEKEMREDMTRKAVKLRELKDALKGCSARLQGHVKNNKLLQNQAPMSAKSVSEIKAAAFCKPVKGDAVKVPAGAHV